MRVYLFRYISVSVFLAFCLSLLRDFVLLRFNCVSMDFVISLVRSFVIEFARPLFGSLFRSLCLSYLRYFVSMSSLLYFVRSFVISVIR